nr:glycosyltransferase [Allosalinactinospora lopnorensis]
MERKGVDTVIRALAWLPRAELTVVGGPAPDDPALSGERGPDGEGDPDVLRLRAVAAECGVTGRVRFTGRAPRAEIPALMRSADAVVSVPWYEPFGIVPVEAMACGVPVVASQVGGHRDTVIHGYTGLLLPPREPRTLALALHELSRDPVQRESYGIFAAERAASCYSWAFVAERTERVYGAVLAGSPVSEAAPERSAHQRPSEPASSAGRTR